MKQVASITPDRMRAFFHPQSIALVGATGRSPWSLNTYQNLKTFGFSGPIFCVNPHHETVHGEPAVKSLSALPQPVDLAYIMVPTQQVFSVIKEAADIGISNLVILTSGFSELGVQGRQLEQQIREFAQEHTMVLLGPNGNGFINVTAHTVPYGLPVLPPLTRGPVGIVLQSGALASAVLTIAQARHIGLSLVVSMGNEAMLSATDIIEYLIEDEDTKVIAVFLESIRNAEAFRRLAHKALEHQKPIVALKVGKSELSTRTAQAHTGALVGNDAVNDAVFKQLGIVRVTSLEDLLITAGVFGYSKPFSGRRMGAVTPSGGACSIISDRAQEEHIPIPPFAHETVASLQKILPSFSTVQNPLDVTGYIVIDRTLLQRALEVVVEDPGLDFVVCLTDPPRIEPLQLEPTLETYRKLTQIIRNTRFPVLLLSNTSVDISTFGHTIIEHTGLHFVGGIEHGLRALGRVLWWYETARELSTQSVAQQFLPTSTSKEPRVGKWSEGQARNLLQSYMIPVVPGVLATNAQEALVGAQTFGFPIAMKVQSHDIAHKSDIGGVLLNLTTEDEVRAGYQTIMEQALLYVSSATIEGILVSPMRPQGIELLVGIVRDPVWGLVLALGLGGIWVETFKDPILRVLPLHRNDIKRMLQEMHGAALLQGVRGQTPVNLNTLIDVIWHLTRVAESLQDELEALEINPLLLYDNQIEALDALITWKQ